MSSSRHAPKFVPAQFQKPLDLEKIILKNQTEHDEQVPMDVLFVGAGPSGLSGAIHLAQLVQKAKGAGEDIDDIEIGVLEKAENLGGHILSGAVINPRAIKELFPEMDEKDFPFRGKVQGDKVVYLTPTGSMRLPTPPTMHNSGNYVASLCEVVQWLGEKAEGLGINLFNSFPVDSLLTEQNKVTGVRTTPAGLNRDGQPGAQHMPATDVTARLTVLSEGTRGLLTQAYCQWQNIGSKFPQIYALGVKEILKTSKPLKYVTHSMGWPLPTDAFGGSFMYPMGEDLIALGLVVGLDYKAHNLDVHGMLQELKQHPFFRDYTENAETVEWGAKTIPEGGFHALPERMHGDGLIMIGDAVGLVNVPALKGIHYAMKSGMLAAETIFEALKKKDFSSETLKSYDEKLKSSYIYKDLKKVRGMRHAFKGGFYSGAIKAGLMTVTGGAFPDVSDSQEEDAAENKEVSLGTMPTHKLSKVDAVYLSGNKTRDDIPQHLSVGEDISEDLADFYTHMCPAGVYEQQNGKLVVNAPNCVDCKATDVLGPRWQPREGSSGPNYTKM